MKKVDLMKKTELPKLLIGGVSIYAISWLIVYVVGIVLVKIISTLMGTPERYSQILSGGVPDASAIYSVGFLTGLTMIVGIALLVFAVAYDEFLFTQEIKGTKKNIFWGSVWGLTFVIFDSVSSSICFNRVGSGDNFTCNTFSVASSTGILYWLLILLIIFLPVLAEYWRKKKK